MIVVVVVATAALGAGAAMTMRVSRMRRGAACSWIAQASIGTTWIWIEIPRVSGAALPLFAVALTKLAVYCRPLVINILLLGIVLTTIPYLNF